MRAKHIAWILAVLLIAAGAVLVVSESPSGKSTSMELAEVISGIEILKGSPDIEFIGNHQDDCLMTRAGGKLDRVRNWFRLPKRYVPLEMQVFSFRDSQGRFLVQYYTTRDGLFFGVEVVLDAGSQAPSTNTMKLVRKCLPKASIRKGTHDFKSRC